MLLLFFIICAINIEIWKLIEYLFREGVWIEIGKELSAP